MAWIVGDGFDYYGSSADLARSVWDSFDGVKCELTTTTIGTLANGTRFGMGKMLRRMILNAGLWVSKTIGSNELTVFAALAHYRGGALSGTSPEIYIRFNDGTTAQCTVVFESSGNIVLKSGSETGTVLATYAAAFNSDSWHHFQVRVTIHNTTGAITVRKNGSGSDSFTATGLNTRGGTANNYCNAVGLGYGTVISSPPPDSFVDDLLFYSASGAAPNDWVGDVRAIALPVVGAGASAQFTPSATVSTFGQPINSGPVSPAGANTVQFTPYSVAPASYPSMTVPVPVDGRAGVLTKFTINFGGAVTLKVQAALYDVDPATGKPGNLLATSAIVTNPPAGNLDLPVTAGPVLTPQKKYFLAVLSDTAFSNIGASSGSVYVYWLPQAFTSGFPATGAAATVQVSNGIYIVATVSDPATAVSEVGGNGDVDYVYDSTVGHEDLYTMGDLPTTPANVIGVVSKVFIKKSDTGTRNAQVRVRSGATNGFGTDTVLGSTYAYLSKVDPVDPATGLAWTPAAVNAIQVGQKVTA